jgi:sugar lactone lactonase YvrE
MRAGTVTVDVICPRRATLGENPRWDDATGLVRWLDIDDGVVCSVDLAGEHLQTWDVGRPVGSLVLHADGGTLVAVGDAWTRAAPSGVDEASVGLDLPEMRFNDAGVDSLGRVWSATMRCDENLDEPGTGALYRLWGDRLEPVHQGLVAGNGIAWSPDESVFYLVDSGPNVVLRWVFDLEDGPVGEPEVWLGPAHGLADGLAVDVEGGVWLALWGTGRVDRYAADGTLTHVVEVPTDQVTAVGFAGPSLTTMVVTTAATGLDEDEHPHAGALFGTDAPFAGLPLHRSTW